MSLLESMPSSYNAMPYMIGAVVFHRCFAGVYHEMSELGYHGPEGGEYLEDVIKDRQSLPYRMFAGELRHLLGRSPEGKELDYALQGFLSEARGRYVYRSAEIEVVRTQEKIARLSEFEDVPWQDAGALFRHGS